MKIKNIKDKKDEEIPLEKIGIEDKKENHKETFDSLHIKGINIEREIGLVRDCMALSDLRRHFLTWSYEIKDFMENIKLDVKIKQSFYRKNEVLKTVDRGIGIDINDDFCQNLLKNIEIETHKNLDYLAQIPNSYLDEKITLSGQKIEFNDNESLIKIGSKNISLPPFKNEHFLCREMFDHVKGEPVDWSIVYEKMTDDKELDFDKKIKNKRMVYDATEALNNRIKEILNTNNDLFTFKEKTITRNY